MRLRLCVGKEDQQLLCHFVNSRWPLRPITLTLYHFVSKVFGGGRCCTGLVHLASTLYTTYNDRAAYICYVCVLLTEIKYLKFNIHLI